MKTKLVKEGLFNKKDKLDIVTIKRQILYMLDFAERVKENPPKDFTYFTEKVIDTLEEIQDILDGFDFQERLQRRIK